MLCNYMCTACMWHAFRMSVVVVEDYCKNNSQWVTTHCSSVYACTSAGLLIAVYGFGKNCSWWVTLQCRSGVSGGSFGNSHLLLAAVPHPACVHPDFKGMKTGTLHCMPPAMCPVIYATLQYQHPLTEGQDLSTWSCTTLLQ